MRRSASGAARETRAAFLNRMTDRMSAEFPPEDDFWLAQALANDRDVEKSFETFQRQRFPKVRSIVDRSYWLGAFIHAGWPRLRDLLFGAMPAWAAARSMDSVYRL